MQRAFGALRKARERGRVLTAEPRLSTTAAKSDLWIPAPASGGIELFGLAVAHVLIARGGDAVVKRFPSFAAIAKDSAFAPESVASALGLPLRLVEQTIEELASSPRPLVLVDRGPLLRQVIGLGLNVLLGSVGRTGGLVRHPTWSLPEGLGTAQKTNDEFPRSAKEPVVLLYGANPSYLRSPGWLEGLARASFVVSFSPFEDETAAHAQVILPVATPLESGQLAFGSTLDGKPFASVGPAAVSFLSDTLEGQEALIRLARELGVALPWGNAPSYREALAQALGVGGRAAAVASSLAVRELSGDLAEQLRELPKNTPVSPSADFPLALTLHPISSPRQTASASLLQLIALMTVLA
jgi:anaerobic selenocysteine-containing dehydrogenase